MIISRYLETKTAIILLSLFFFYLEGATPTKLGPNPLNNERGPSFSRITLKREKEILERNVLLSFTNILEQNQFLLFIMYLSSPISLL